MMLQACLNGAWDRAFHAATPLTPAELAADAARVVAAGAAELHIHPRGPDGLESLEPAAIGAAISAIRAAVPGVPVGVSTHWRIPPGGEARREPIARWREMPASALPDYASVNLIEPDAPQVVGQLLALGVGVEAGLWTVADAERYVRLPEAGRCLRVLIEINHQDEAEGLAETAGILDVLARAGSALPVLLHGLDATKWPLYREAVRRGLDSRIGLEDGRDLPDGTVAADNAALIGAAVGMLR